MTKKSILILALLFQWNLLYSQTDVIRYQGIISSVMDNLDIIIGNNQSSDAVYSSFLIADNAIRNNRISVAVDPSLDSILKGVNFTVNDSGQSSLVFGRMYLDTYNANSSIHYSVLIQEYRRIFDYLQDPGTFLNRMNDIKEYYWYSLDALRAKAEFINYYLAGRFTLTQYEEYINSSFRDDFLNIASIFILRESMNYFFYFHYLELMYFDNEYSREYIIHELTENGELLIWGFNNTSDEFMRYIRYTEIYTYRKFLTRLLSIIGGEVFAENPGMGRVYNEMSNLLALHNDTQSRYYSSTMNFWEDSLFNR